MRHTRTIEMLADTAVVWRGDADGVLSRFVYADPSPASRHRAVRFVFREANHLRIRPTVRAFGWTATKQYQED